MGVFKAFKTCEKVEREGVTIDYGDGDWVKIARAGGSNQGFKNLIERYARKYKKQIQLDAMPEGEMKEILYRAYAEHVILDFCVKNPETGKPFPVNPESCMEMFRLLPDFFADIKNQADNLALFREEIDAESAKN